MPVTVQIIEVGRRQYDFMHLIVTNGGVREYTLEKILMEELKISKDRAKKQIRESLQPLVDKGYLEMYQRNDNRNRISEVYYLPTELGKLMLPRLRARESDSQ